MATTRPTWCESHSAVFSLQGPQTLKCLLFRLLLGKVHGPPKSALCFLPFLTMGHVWQLPEQTGGAVLLQGTHVLGFFGHFSLSSGASRVARTVKSHCNVGHPGSIPGSGRSPGEWNGYPLW